MSSARDVAKCADAECPLYEFGDGHNLSHKGIGWAKAQKAISGKLNPSQDGIKKILQTVTEGKKRIRVIVDGVE